jgi:hypothetical protein
MFYLCIVLVDYYCYYLYCVARSHFVPCLLLLWRVLCPPWWISGMLNKYNAIQYVKWHLFRLGLLDHSESDRCKQASETVSYTFCDCKTLAIYRFRHLGQHSVQPGDFEYNTAFCCRCGTAKCMNVRAAEKINTGSVNGSLQCPPALNSILFYSILVCSVLFLYYRMDEVLAYFAF